MSGAEEHTIGRLKPILYTRISRGRGIDRLNKAGLFFGRGLIRTVECIGIYGFTVRIVKGGANAAAQRTKRRTNTWQAPSRT